MNPEAFPNKTAVSFAREVPAGATDEQSFTVDDDSTVERVAVRVYRGAENTLHVTPLVETADGNRFDLIQLSGKSFVDGDDDKFVFDVSESVEEGDTIVIRANNTDQSNAHNYRANVEIDRLGGLARVGNTVLERLGVNDAG